MRTSTLAGLALVAVVACAPDTKPVARQATWTFDTVFTMPDEGWLFARPNHEFAMLLRDPARVLLLDAKGDSVRAFGRDGKGPGEFLMARGLVFRGESVQVLDMGNLRMVSFLESGKPVATRPIPVAMAGNMFTLLDGDTLLIATQGQHEALAVRQAPDGNVINRYGTPTSPAVTFYMMGEIAKTIASGRIPDEMKNQALPVEGCHGDVWLAEQVTGRITRYSRDGKALATFQLPAKHVEQQTAAFFEKNRTAKPNMFYSLRTVNDAAATDEGLWLALETADSLPAHMLLVDTLGTASDVEVPGLKGNVAAVDGASCEEILLRHPDSGLVLRGRR